jgi:hypothetical protein
MTFKIFVQVRTYANGTLLPYRNCSGCMMFFQNIDNLFSSDIGSLENVVLRKMFPTVLFSPYGAVYSLAFIS